MAFQSISEFGLGEIQDTDLQNLARLSVGHEIVKPTPGALYASILLVVQD